MQILRFAQNDTKNVGGGRRNREVAGVLPPVSDYQSRSYTSVTGVYGE